MDQTEFEMRDRLRRTWTQLIGRLDGSEFPAHMIFETLADVATDGMAREYGASAASHMLRLSADALEAAEQTRAADLIHGPDAGGMAARPGP